MAIEKNIIIGADLSGLEKKLDELIEALKASQKQADKTAESVEGIAENTKDIGDSAKESQKGIKGLGAGFKGLGVAIKAAGIGLLLQAMGILKELFDNNQKTVDFFNTTFNTLQVAFSDFAKWIESNIGTFTGFFKDIFENPKERVMELGSAIYDGLVVRFKELLEVFGYVGKAMKSLVTGDFMGAMDAIKEAGRQTADVITGTDDSFDSLVETVKNTAKSVSDYTKETIKQGQAMTEVNKQSELAEVRMQGLIEKYDLQAEKLRQVRDDERLSMDERIKANEELGEVLKEQEKVMLENAQRIVNAKAQQLSLDKNNVEFQKEYMAAVNELSGVQAQVAGFRSEQLMNEMALQRELVDLEISKKENAQEVAEIEAEAAIEAEMNLQKQLELEEQLNQQLYDSRLASLEQQKALYVEGTQAYQDMVSEINILNAERTAQEGEEARKRRDLEKQVQDAKVQMSTDAISALNDLAQAFFGDNEKNAKKAFLVNKAAGIANAVINTSQAVTKALAETTDPSPTQSFRFANAAIAAATGAAQVMAIARQQFQASGSVDTNIGGGGGATAPSMSPSFNLVGTSGQNAILESLQRNPVKAYVVGSDVTSQQQLDRNRINQVSFP